jgi:hypothetical protein
MPVQRAHGHEQVEEVRCAPEPGRRMEPKPPGELPACQAACTAIDGGMGTEALLGVSLTSHSPGIVRRPV